MIPDERLAEERLPDGYVAIETPAGLAFVAFSPAGVRFLAMGTDHSEFEHRYRARFGRPLKPAVQLPETVAGAVRCGNPVPADFTGESPFTRAVLSKAQEIPAGEVRSYAWVAEQIGRPRAVRAVGSALGRNPVPVLVPCHRVVRSDGRLGDYALGSSLKRRLLAAEGFAGAGTSSVAGLLASVVNGSSRLTVTARR